MIASFLHNFVFIKTKKTAGTAVEVALGDICGPSDIVTPLGPADEIIRGNGHPVCRNFGMDPALEEELRQSLIVNDVPRCRSARLRCEFYAHMPATEIKDKLDPDFWRSAYKITVVRHPYETAVSVAYFDYRPRKRIAFPQFLDRVVRQRDYGNFGFYSIAGVPVVDEFLRHETLHADLKRVGAKLGFSVPDELRRMKAVSRKDRRPARDILTEEQKEIVFERCRPEFELFGYER